jgi:hypothetical protein
LPVGGDGAKRVRRPQVVDDEVRVRESVDRADRVRDPMEPTSIGFL